MLVEKFTWLNGKIIESYKASCSILTHSLHYASSVFEGIIVLDKKPFKLREHIARLFLSAKIMGINVTFNEKQIEEACHSLINKNILTKEFYYIRPIIYRDIENMTIIGDKNSMANIAIIIKKHSNLFPQKNSLRLFASSWKKPQPYSMPHQSKCSGNYMLSILSKQEASKKNFDDALLLDYDNKIAEAASANIFFIKNKTLLTPKTKNCLNGITRQEIIRIAIRNNFEVKETDIKLEDINNFDESFLTGTTIGVRNVKSISFLSNVIDFKSSKLSNLISKLYLSVLKDS